MAQGSGFGAQQDHPSPEPRALSQKLMASSRSERVVWHRRIQSGALALCFFLNSAVPSAWALRSMGTARNAKSDVDERLVEEIDGPTVKVAALPQPPVTQVPPPSLDPHREIAERITRTVDALPLSEEARDLAHNFLMQGYVDLMSPEEVVEELVKLGVKDIHLLSTVWAYFSEGLPNPDAAESAYSRLTDDDRWVIDRVSEQGWVREVLARVRLRELSGPAATSLMMYFGTDPGLAEAYVGKAAPVSAMAGSRRGGASSNVPPALRSLQPEDRVRFLSILDQFVKPGHQNFATIRDVLAEFFASSDREKGRAPALEKLDGLGLSQADRIRLVDEIYRSDPPQTPGTTGQVFREILIDNLQAELGIFFTEEQRTILWEAEPGELVTLSAQFFAQWLSTKVPADVLELEIASQTRQGITFGTAGWRSQMPDVLPKDTPPEEMAKATMTIDRIRLVAQVFADYVNARHTRGEDPGKDQVIPIGFDGRTHSREFAEAAARVVAASGLRALLVDMSRYPDGLPTPITAFAMRHWNAAGSIMITASHNRATDNGIEVRDGISGGQFLPSAMKEMEASLQVAPVIRTATSVDHPRIERIDPLPPYVEYLKTLVDVDAIRGASLRIGYDAVHGMGYVAPAILRRLGLNPPAVMLRGELRDDLGDAQRQATAEPSREALEELAGRTFQDGLDASFSNDGDADRAGLILSDGRWLSPNEFYSWLAFEELAHLKADSQRRGESWDPSKYFIGRTIGSTHWVDAIAKTFGLPEDNVVETPVGFKYLNELINRANSEGKVVVLVFEESGGAAVRGSLPDKDGIAVNLKLMEIAARAKAAGQTTAERYEAFRRAVPGPLNVRSEFRLLGRGEATPALIDRMKATLEQFAKASVGKDVFGARVERVRTDDGTKLFFEDGSWILLRRSGTEALFRIYIEAPNRSAWGVRAMALRDYLGKEFELSERELTHFSRDIDAVERALAREILSEEFNAPRGQRGRFEPLFKDKDPKTGELLERGGWVHRPWEVLKSTLPEDVERKAQELRAQGVEALGFVGMGGESSIIGTGDEHLLNIGSTAPDKLAEALEGRNLTKIRWYIISKSGGTTETKRNGAFLEKAYLDPTKFITYVGDPWTSFDEKTKEGFTVEHRELNDQKSIGGRNTLVNNPTLLAYAWRHPQPGAVRAMLETLKKAHTFADGADDPWIAGAVDVFNLLKEGRPKVGIIQPAPMRAARWVAQEQNPEESLGKDGKGFTAYTTLPNLETVAQMQQRGWDKGWVFVEFRVKGHEHETQSYAEEAKRLGHAVVTIPVNGADLDMASQIAAYGWMKFVAMIGGLWDINFSNQDPVEEYKGILRAAAERKEPLILNDAIQPAGSAVANDGALTLVYDGLLPFLSPNHLAEVKQLEAVKAGPAAIFAKLSEFTRSSFDALTLLYYDHVDASTERWLDALTQGVLHQGLLYAAKWGEGTGTNHGLFVNHFSGPLHQIPLHVISAVHEREPDLAYPEGSQTLIEGTVAPHRALVKEGRPSIMLIVNGQLDRSGQQAIERFFEDVRVRQSPPPQPQVPATETAGGAVTREDIQLLLAGVRTDIKQPRGPIVRTYLITKAGQQEPVNVEVKSFTHAESDSPFNTVTVTVSPTATGEEMLKALLEAPNLPQSLQQAARQLAWEKAPHLVPIPPVAGSSDAPLAPGTASAASVRAIRAIRDQVWSARTFYRDHPEVIFGRSDPAQPLLTLENQLASIADRVEKEGLAGGASSDLRALVAPLQAIISEVPVHGRTYLTEASRQLSVLLSESSQSVKDPRARAVTAALAKAAVGSVVPSAEATVPTAEATESVIENAGAP